MINLWRKLEDSLTGIKDMAGNSISLGIIMDGGMGAFTEELKDKTVFSFRDIPHFPLPTVEGHQGSLIFGKLHGVNILVVLGRCHYFEGYTMAEVTYPIRLMQRMGIHTLMVTANAVSINEDLVAGSIMLVKDHLNLMGAHPLRGFNHEQFGSRFPIMENAYDPGMLSRAAKMGEDRVFCGIYAAISGPSYPTVAEMKYLKNMGADAVGMALVPEVIVARCEGHPH
jgi:purine-nucleoside phosphorylase